MSLPTDFPSCDACRQGTSSTVKHTCWRRENDAVSHEETRTPQQQHTTNTQPHGPGSVKDGGHQFEMKMAAVIGLRGLQRGESFELFSNRDDAGNFDDLVYTAGGRRYFLQLKHADSPEKKKLTKGDVMTLLLTCFKSYCGIKHGENFRDIPINNSQFVIYTNRELTPALLKHKRRQTEVDIFFKTCEIGETFSFSPDEENKQTDVYTLLENEVKKSQDFRETCDREGVREFLNKLIMVNGQKGQRELDKVIAEEIRKHDVARVNNEVYKTELLEFKTQVEIWCRDKKEKMTTTMFRNWLQEAKTKACASVVRSFFNSCTKKLVDTGIQFSDSEVSRLQAEMSDKRAIHLRSDALALCSILLLDCLDTSKCIFVTFEALRSNKNLLLHAWLGGDWEGLIVFCDSAVQQSDISSTCLEISEFIKRGPSIKQVIILTASSVQEIKDFVSIEHKFNFEQLSELSQKIVLDKKIEFQGCEVTMRSVLQRHGNVEHVLGPELLIYMVTEENTVKIGGTLQVNEGYYAPRELERYIYLHSNVLQNSNDVFAVSGATREDLRKIVPSGKTVEYFSVAGIKNTDFTQDMRNRIFLLLDEDAKNSFLAICEKLEGKTLHWVQFKNGDLLWKMSRGGTETLLDYIDADKTGADTRIITEGMKIGSCEVNEKSIWDLGERTVLVVAEPGMGKSSTTTHVAWITKLSDPTSWVVRINWNDYTRKLHEIDTATFNFDSLFEFLCSSAFPGSKYTKINRSLLKQALQNSGNVTVLMDGFDEISPLHTNKAAVILSELMKTKVARVWVTSRPVQRETLENKLCVTAFSLKRISRDSQIEMLCNLWMLKKGEETLNFDKYLTFINKSVHDENFTGCPLYITMIATVYEMDKKLHLNTGDWNYSKIDLINLYEVFVERKLHIYLTEKQNADITNSCVLDNLEDLKQTLLNTFEKCALVAILPPTVLESLHDKKIEEEILPFLAKVQAGKDKTGVVMNVVDGKPQFVHRTFAEFFTARWFSRNFKYNRNVLERILFDRTYRVITDMFDRMLARDCPLHCGALEDFPNSLLTPLQEGRDINALDKGGRTFMHLISKHQFKTWIPMNRKSESEVSLDITDSVLQWTPLQYAIKLEKWYTVERLLERNVDRSGLDMIRQKAHETGYIYPIIQEAVSFPHSLLFEFLCSIGVNILQAISIIVPSPLSFAIANGELAVIRLLIQQGANCNTRNGNGETPLFDAVSKGSLDVVRILVEEGGASVDVRGDDGRTLIEEAQHYLRMARQDRSRPKYEADIREKIVEYLEERLSETYNKARLEKRNRICIIS